MVTVLEMGAARHFLRMQQLAKTQEERAQLLQPTLEINPRYAQVQLTAVEGSYRLFAPRIFCLESIYKAWMLCLCAI